MCSILILAFFYYIYIISLFSHFFRDNITKSGKVLIKLFQKFAEPEAEPRTNAKASAFATALQKDEVYFGFLDRVDPSRM
jgi:hypothetical protein